MNGGDRWSLTLQWVGKNKLFIAKAKKFSDLIIQIMMIFHETLEVNDCEF